MEPRLDLPAEHEAYLGFSLPVFLPLPCSCTLSLSLSLKINIYLKTKQKKPPKNQRQIFTVDNTFHTGRVVLKCSQIHWYSPHEKVELILLLLCADWTQWLTSHGQNKGDVIVCDFRDQVSKGLWFSSPPSSLSFPLSDPGFGRRQVPCQKDPHLRTGPRVRSWGFPLRARGHWSSLPAATRGAWPWPSSPCHAFASLRF